VPASVGYVWETHNDTSSAVHVIYLYITSPFSAECYALPYFYYLRLGPGSGS